MNIANSRFLNKGDPSYIVDVKELASRVNHIIDNGKRNGYDGADIGEDLFSYIEEKYDIHNALVEAGYQVYLNDKTPGIYITVMWDNKTYSTETITGKRSRSD